MQFYKEHICQLFWIGLLLMGILSLSERPPTDSFFIPGDSSRTVVASHSGISDSKKELSEAANTIEVAFSEQKESEDSDTGMNTLDFTDQALLATFLPVKGLQAISHCYAHLVWHKTQDYSVLLYTFSFFIFKVNPPPLISGIAINAP